MLELKKPLYRIPTFLPITVGSAPSRLCTATSDAVIAGRLRLSALRAADCSRRRDAAQGRGLLGRARRCVGPPRRDWGVGVCWEAAAATEEDVEALAPRRLGAEKAS